MAARQVLAWSLRAGAAYFMCVTAAHWWGLKVPGLYIYYSLPSYAYQDKGIGILAFGWAMFLLAASRQVSIVPFLIAAGVAGILGFSAINLTDEVARLAPAGGAGGYWGVVAGLAAYLGWVTVWWQLAERNKR